MLSPAQRSTAYAAHMPCGPLRAQRSAMQHTCYTSAEAVERRCSDLMMLALHLPSMRLPDAARRSSAS